MPKRIMANACSPLLIAGLFLLSLAATNAAEKTFPIEVTLSPDKDAYRLREKITFTVTVRNRSEDPISILVRGRDGSLPLGILELYKGDPKEIKTTFDVCDLACGTGLENGFIGPGEEMTLNISVGENSTWGPPGPYRFVFHVASPQKRRNGPYSFQADSNIANIEITE